MIVCESSKLLYLAPPKTATCTIMSLLAKHHGGEVPDYYYAHHGVTWDEAYRDWYIFISIRHPYTRMHSMWQFAKVAVTRLAAKKEKEPLQPGEQWWLDYFGDYPTFEEFLHNPATVENSAGVWSIHWQRSQIPRSLDKVVRFERLQRDVRRIPGLRHTDIPHENINRSKTNYLEDYTEVTQQRVRELLPDEFEPLGYTSDFERCRNGQWFA